MWTSRTLNPVKTRKGTSKTKPWIIPRWPTTVLDKIFGRKWTNPVKLDRTIKVWYLLSRAFWLLLQKFDFRETGN